MNQSKWNRKLLKKKENILFEKIEYQQIKNKSKVKSFPFIVRKSISKLFKYKNFIKLIILVLLLSFYSIPTKLETSYKKIENYIKFNLAGHLSHPPSEFYKRENPEISIVVSTFNGEVYLKPAVRSIQNQNFLNIEIIIVDDGSIDKSIKVIKELMEEDKRIKLLSNGINRGTLYTKTRGVLNAKGKYVMTLDHDNLYATEEVFFKLYREAEKYNLDLLGFSTIDTGVEIKNIEKKNYLNYFKTKVIKKPELKKRFLGFDSSIESGTYLCLYFIKIELFIKVIKQLGDKFIKRNIDAGDDTILMFLLSRKAMTLKHLKEIFYILLIWPKEFSESLKFQRKIKYEERERKNCYSYLTFIEILFIFTENSDKLIADKFFSIFFLNNAKCKNNTDTIN